MVHSLYSDYLKKAKTYFKKHSVLHEKILQAGLNEYEHEQ